MWPLLRAGAEVREGRCESCKRVDEAGVDAGRDASGTSYIKGTSYGLHKVDNRKANIGSAPCPEV